MLSASQLIAIRSGEIWLCTDRAVYDHMRYIACGIWKVGNQPIGDNWISSTFRVTGVERTCFDLYSYSILFGLRPAIGVIKDKFARWFVVWVDSCSSRFRLQAKNRT